LAGYEKVGLRVPPHPKFGGRVVEITPSHPFLVGLLHKNWGKNAVIKINNLSILG
jgi:hypothetical protein